MTPARTPSANLPACEDVWVEGRDVENAYDGCAQGDSTVPADRLRCSSGQFVVTYDDRFFATLGGRVVDTGDGGLNKSKQYRDVVMKCRA